MKTRMNYFVFHHLSFVTRHVHKRKVYCIKTPHPVCLDTQQKNGLEGLMDSIELDWYIGLIKSVIPYVGFARGCAAEHHMELVSTPLYCLWQMTTCGDSFFWRNSSLFSHKDVIQFLKVFRRATKSKVTSCFLLQFKKLKD